MLLKIVQAGEPVLRQQARELTPDEIRSSAVQQLIELMRETMRDAPGVGLAAPQVGLPLQLAVIEDSAAYLAGVPPARLAALEREAVPFHVIINPKLTFEDPTPVSHFEGCLSVEGFTAVVPRARAVKVEALDDKGQPFIRGARGWYARILQHEIDHLGGTLYIDRMQTRSFHTTTNQARYWAGRPLDEVRQVLGLKG